jgi:hypothetical protein
VALQIADVRFTDVSMDENKSYTADAEKKQGTIRVIHLVNSGCVIIY